MYFSDRLEGDRLLDSRLEGLGCGSGDSTDSDSGGGEGTKSGSV